MKVSKRKELKNYCRTENCSKPGPLSSELVLTFCETVGLQDPAEAMRKCARTLIGRSGLKHPPFRPAIYADLRNVNRILYRTMEAEGHLIKEQSGFTIELRRDRSHERKNFTCAHEVGHTFFYEFAPSIKNRRMAACAEPDAQEEFLCNVAASELLMPLDSLQRVATDYLPSPKALKELASGYETSITAMAVRLASLNLWRAKFILWDRSGSTVRARWVVGPDRPLKHFPQIEIENYERSSIIEAFNSSDSVVGEEWLCNERRFTFYKMTSLHLGEDRVLTCVGSFSKQLGRRSGSSTALLPVDYACTCNGTGTRLILKEGRVYASKCLANHISGFTSPS